jgi:acyl-CoA synthetase (AMP-forming)/AMP-acid ligase II
VADNDRFIDELLDSALTQQRRAEPGSRLEGRILAHVRTASERNAGRKTWELWLAAAATAAIVVFFAIHLANRSQSPVRKTSQASNAVPVPSPTETLKANSEPAPAAADATKVVEPKQAARRERKTLRRAEAHHWPSQFPTPAPLTAEQRALVQYVRETPPQVLAAPILKADFTVHRVKIKPLDIPSLEIRPFALGPVEEEVQ